MIGEYCGSYANNLIIFACDDDECLTKTRDQLHIKLKVEVSVFGIINGIYIYIYAYSLFSEPKSVALSKWKYFNK